MDTKAFLTYMKLNDARYYKTLLIIFLVFAALIGVGFKAEKMRSKQVKQYNEQMKILQKSYELRNQYENNKSALQSGALKQVLSKTKVEDYQANLLKMLEDKRIKVQNTAMLKTTKENINFIEYEATWLGSWPSIMNALKTMETEPIAINFNSIKLETNENEKTVKAVIKYKIYLTD